MDLPPSASGLNVLVYHATRRAGQQSALCRTTLMRRVALSGSAMRHQKAVGRHMANAGMTPAKRAVVVMLVSMVPKDAVWGTSLSRYNCPQS